jgi:hypothetical protein
MPPSSRRITVDDPSKDWTKVLGFDEYDKTDTYYQVTVGSYGVCLPKTLNMDTLNGLQLTDGVASVIRDKKLAERIAQKTGGKLLEATERFTRTIVEVKG